MGWDTQKVNEHTHRFERDSMGEIAVPVDALWGAQTQRALQYGSLSWRRLPRSFFHAIGLIKAAASRANGQLELLPQPMAATIEIHALAVAEGRYDAHFPLDVFQTGSATSTHMNVNEVLANLSSATLGQPVHPNDHVNMGQSSNDVIPTTLRVAAVLACQATLIPALSHLRRVIVRRGRTLGHIVKNGRTHLMDAMPITMEQEFEAWSAQIASAINRINDTLVRLRRLPLGGTAVGTGINTHVRFAPLALATLNELSCTGFELAANRFEGIAAQDDIVELSGQLNALAVALIKIANDLRWMNSGPHGGLAEIQLAPLQPGSSIMPGKVNPVIPEAVIMVAAQVIGYHTAVTVGGQSGNFQLNVTLPLLAANVLDAIELLGQSANALADRVIATLTVCRDSIERRVMRNPILVTALSPLIGYEKAAAIAKRASEEQRSLFDVAREDSGLSAEQLSAALDPQALTRGGLPGQ